MLSASCLTTPLTWLMPRSLVIKPYCTSTHPSTHHGPTGPRRRIEALTKHLFCDISRTAGSCAYRRHSMPVTPQGVLPCAAQPPARLLIARTSLLLFREIEVVYYSSQSWAFFESASGQNVGCALSGPCDEAHGRCLFRRPSDRDPAAATASFPSRAALVT